MSETTPTPRLIDLAAAAGLSRPELRAILAREVDRATRGQVRAVTERDLALFRTDPGYVGPRNVSTKQSWPSQDGSSDYTDCCPACGRRYGLDDRDRLGRRRCSRCTHSRPA